MVYGSFSWFGLDPLVLVKGFFFVTAYNNIIDASVLLCDISLGKTLSCFSMTRSLCTKRGPYRNGLSRLVCQNLTCLHRVLTATPSNTFGMNWNADCEPGLIIQHQCSTSLMLMAEWKQVPAAMFQHLVESLPRRVEAVIAAEEGPTPY